MHLIEPHSNKLRPARCEDTEGGEGPVFRQKQTLLQCVAALCKSDDESGDVPRHVANRIIIKEEGAQCSWQARLPFTSPMNHASREVICSLFAFFLCAAVFQGLWQRQGNARRKWKLFANSNVTRTGSACNWQAGSLCKCQRSKLFSVRHRNF